MLRAAYARLTPTLAPTPARAALASRARSPMRSHGDATAPADPTQTRPPTVNTGLRAPTLVPRATAGGVALRALKVVSAPLVIAAASACAGTAGAVAGAVLGPTALVVMRYDYDLLASRMNRHDRSPEEVMTSALLFTLGMPVAAAAGALAGAASGAVHGACLGYALCLTAPQNEPPRR